jgi:hypothetical protein
MGQQRSVRICHNTHPFHALAYWVRSGLSPALSQEHETAAHLGMSNIMRYISLTNSMVYRKFMDKLTVIQLFKKFREEYYLLGRNAVYFCVVYRSLWKTHCLHLETRTVSKTKKQGDAANKLVAWLTFRLKTSAVHLKRRWTSIGQN